MKIGFVGVPPLELINKYKSSFPSSEWIDLDVPRPDINRKNSMTYLPETTCSVIQTILSNITALKPEILLAPTGASKCDSMRFLIPIIKMALKEVEIIECENDDKKNFGHPICTSGLPLTRKFDLITANVTNTDPRSTDHIALQKTKPVAGFWGVPPYDFSILKLFPNNTHVFGWTRCMENKTPHNLELELYVEPGLPTVFFSQSFCQKNILAKELASIHKGLYVEVDGVMDKSTQAKITAFLELRNCY
jgi:hypothetical protein